MITLSTCFFSRLGKEVREEVGDVTILVNNAAIVYVTDLLSRTDEMICKTFQVNILAHFRVNDYD